VIPTLPSHTNGSWGASARAFKALASIRAAVQFIEWMSRTILEQEMTILLVTHDRAFMETMCTKLLELDSGKGYLHEIGGEGSYKQFLKLRQQRRDAQASAAQDAKACPAI